MKTAEPKTTATIQRQSDSAQQPFFQKQGEGNGRSFFSGERAISLSGGEEGSQPFFSPTTIQPKLTIGQPNDKYEVEADTMADKVVQRLANPSSSVESVTATTAPAIQHKCSDCEEKERLQKMEGEEELISKKEIDLQRKPIFESGENPSEENIIRAKFLPSSISPIIQRQEEEVLDHVDKLHPDQDPNDLLEEINPSIMEGRMRQTHCTQNCPATASAMSDYLQTGDINQAHCNPFMERDANFGYQIGGNHSRQLRNWQRAWNYIRRRTRRHGQFVVVEGDRVTPPSNLTRWHYFIILNIRNRRFVVDAFIHEVTSNIRRYIRNLGTRKYTIYTNQFSAQPIIVQPSLQRKPITRNGIQRKCATCGKEEERPIQEKSETSAPSTASVGLQSQLNSSKGGGSPLSSVTLNSMEGAFGADFSGVRIHTNSSAIQMNQELGAQAFTHGSDIYFNAGKFDDGSSGGQHLLAHELTHTVQQGGGIKNRIQKSEDEPDTVSVAIKLQVNRSMLKWSREKLIRHYVQLEFEKSEEEVRELFQKNPTAYKVGFPSPWKIEPEDLERGHMIIDQKVSSREFMKKTSSDTIDEPRLPGGKREGYEKRKEKFEDLPSSEKTRINAEVDQRYWDRTGDEGTRIDEGEKGKEDAWLDIRDEVLAQNEFMKNLPYKVKKLIQFQAGGKEILPKDYEQMTRVAKEIMSLSDAGIENYLNSNPISTTNLDEFEAAIKRFKKENVDEASGESEMEGGEASGESEMEGGEASGESDVEGDEASGESDVEGGETSEKGGRGGGKEDGKKGGSKYGRLGLIELPEDVIKILETAAEILGDPEALLEIENLIEELNNLHGISSEVKNIFANPENLLLVSLGLLDNTALEKIDEWVFKKEKKRKKKGKKKGIKKILQKVKTLLGQVKIVLKPIFLARRKSKQIQFKAALLIDKLPLRMISKLLNVAKNSGKTSLSGQAEVIAQRVSKDIVTDLKTIPNLFKKLGNTGQIELIDKQDLARVLSQAITKLAGGIYGKVANKIGLGEKIAEVASHGIKHVIPEEVVDLINDNLSSIFNAIKPMVESASEEVEEIFEGMEGMLSDSLIPGVKSLVSPKNKDGKSASIRNGGKFLNTINNSKGNNLPKETQHDLKPHFGNELQDVKIHTDKKAQDANDQMDSKAFTINNDIYFGENQYNPESLEGKHLLSHEVTHVHQHKQNNEHSLINKSPKKNNIRQRLVKRITQNVLKGTGLTNNSIRGKKFIDYGYRDKYDRPQGIIARLKKTISGGSKASNHIRPPGFRSGSFGHARCHLLGNQLGGSGKDRRNLVTCFQTVNNEVMRPLENEVADAVAKGETVLYKVFPIYRSKNSKSKIPKQIHIIAKGDRGLRIDEKLTNKR